MGVFEERVPSGTTWADYQARRAVAR